MSVGCLLIITLLIVLPPQSYSFRQLYEQTHVSSSPGPSYGVNLASGGSNFQKTCRTSCHLKNITACLTYCQSDEEMCLVVHNNGESPLQVKIMILPAKNMIKEINITSHQMKKVNISSDVDLSSTIALTTNDGDCVISTAAAPSPENHYWRYSTYKTYITPTNSAYVLILVVLIIGGILTFFKLRTRVRHLDGVPYRELEMGDSTTVNVEETENWDQDWDDQWDDEKPVKSGGDNHVLVKQANDLITKLPNSNGRRKEWDD